MRVARVRATDPPRPPTDRQPARDARRQPPGTPPGNPPPPDTPHHPVGAGRVHSHSRDPPQRFDFACLSRAKPVPTFAQHAHRLTRALPPSPFHKYLGGVRRTGAEPPEFSYENSHTRRVSGARVDRAAGETPVSFPPARPGGLPKGSGQSPSLGATSSICTWCVQGVYGMCMAHACDPQVPQPAACRPAQRPVARHPVMR